MGLLKSSGLREIHADFMGADTQLVWYFIGTRIGFMFHMIHACSYAALHGVRVRHHRIRMGPSGEFYFFHQKELKDFALAAKD
jgi:hypothetical protein